MNLSVRPRRSAQMMPTWSFVTLHLNRLQAAAFCFNHRGAPMVQWHWSTCLPWYVPRAASRAYLCTLRVLRVSTAKGSKIESKHSPRSTLSEGIQQTVKTLLISLLVYKNTVNTIYLLPISANNMGFCCWILHFQFMFNMLYPRRK